MTMYEITIIGYGDAGITVYDGEDEGKYNELIQITSRVLAKVNYSTTSTQRCKKDGTEWSNEVIFFIRED